jgi:hypothetical protein
MRIDGQPQLELGGAASMRPPSNFLDLIAMHKKRAH